MTKSELKSLVKSYFKLTEATDTTTESNPEGIEFKFTEAKLEDGTVITNMVEGDFEAGQELHVITEEGEHLIAPAGEHKTESGIIITVGEEGIIESVVYPTEEVEEDEAEAADEEVAIEEVAMEEHVVEEETLEEEPVEVEAEEDEAAPTIAEIVEEVMNVVSSEIEEMRQKLAEVEEKIAMQEEAYAKAPATNPVHKALFNRANKEETKKEFSAKDAQMEMVLKAFKNKK